MANKITSGSGHFQTDYVERSDSNTMSAVATSNRGIKYSNTLNQKQSFLDYVSNENNTGSIILNTQTLEMGNGGTYF